MILSLITAIVMGFFGSMPVAGPIAFLVFARGVQGRYREGLLVAAGGAVAQAIMAGGAYLGSGHLLQAFEGLVPIFLLAAAVLLPALGIMLLRWSPVEPSEDMVSSRKKAVKGLLLGFSVTIVNPTPLATWGAATAFLFASGYYEFSPYHAPAFGVGVGLGKVLWFFVLIKLIRHYKGHFSARKIALAMRALGLLLIAFGLHFAVEAAKSVGWF